MELEILFDKIKGKAISEAAFREQLLSAYEGDRPIIGVCEVCRDAGIEVYPMDLADADESAYAAMRRSTNGGGENSPHLTWEGEILEALMDEIRHG